MDASFELLADQMGHTPSSENSLICFLVLLLFHKKELNRRHVLL